MYIHKILDCYKILGMVFQKFFSRSRKLSSSSESESIRNVLSGFSTLVSEDKKFRAPLALRQHLFAIANSCWVAEMGTIVLGDGSLFSELTKVVIMLNEISDSRAAALLQRAEQPSGLPASLLFFHPESSAYALVSPALLKQFGGDGCEGSLNWLFARLCRETAARSPDALGCLRDFSNAMVKLAEMFPLSEEERVATLYSKQSSRALASPLIASDQPVSAVHWLNALNGAPSLQMTADLFEPDYFDRVNWRQDFRRNKNEHLILAKNNLYENWQSHAAIPSAFLHFICNPAYVGRGELALYMKMALLLDQRGICYPSYDELKEGLFKHAKQVSPVMNDLLRKHFFLRSNEKVKIPWLGARSDYARYIYQRPMAAYTIARLHYLGFEELAIKRGVVQQSQTRFLDVKTFNQCVDMLLRVYTSRSDKEIKNRSSQARRMLSELDIPPPEISLAAIKEWLYKTFLTDEEKERVLVDEKFINRRAARNHA